MGKDKQKLKRKLLELLFSSSDDESENKKRKNRIISDSESDEEKENVSNNELSSEFLAKIGHIPEKNNSFALNPDIAKIWQKILIQGLEEEAKKSILSNIATIKNLNTSAPTLNTEIKASLSQHAITRDEHLCKKQNDLGAAICGLSHILQEKLDSNDTITAEKLSSCIRLLCNVHNMESKTRRAVILPGLNKNVKEALEKTEITEMLFGKNVSDLIKETRTIERSTKDLRASQPLNNWGPSSSRQKQGGLSNQRKQQPIDRRNRNNDPNRRRQQQRQQLRPFTKPKQQNRSYNHPRRQQ